ncbi:MULTISPECIES: helix-turn-helix transcriptional regulator [unclassified Sphingomonas]|uniref:ArsR/SmtB family transcription factor n=1 Tax=unclassified Sphingomonas TaxID=196159 RepID=UPI001E3949B0|nr:MULTISPECIES: metalloregulator ArsR/SmtB family transcription factor [unclassified Sphingomonas]
MAVTTPATIFAALGDSTRLALLVALRSGGTRSIARLAAASGMTRQAVTKHLKVLERVGLLRVERRGRETHFIYCPEALDGARAYLDAIGGRWADVQSAVRPATPVSAV